MPLSAPPAAVNQGILSINRNSAKDESRDGKNHDGNRVESCGKLCVFSADKWQGILHVPNENFVPHSSDLKIDPASQTRIVGSCARPFTQDHLTHRPMGISG